MVVAARVAGRGLVVDGESLFGRGRSDLLRLSGKDSGALARATSAEEEECDYGQDGDDDEDEQRDEQVRHCGCERCGLRGGDVGVGIADHDARHIGARCGGDFAWGV